MTINQAKTLMLGWSLEADFLISEAKVICIGLYLLVLLLMRLADFTGQAAGQAGQAAGHSSIGFSYVAFAAIMRTILVLGRRMCLQLTMLWSDSGTIIHPILPQPLASPL